MLLSQHINYDNSNIIYTLKNYNISLKTCYGQIDSPTDQQTDIATYKAAIAAKNENAK